MPIHTVQCLIVLVVSGIACLHIEEHKR
jgi:hypothetical protein